MNYVLVTPQPRGQITLPKRFRDKLGIRPGIPVKVFEDGLGVKVEPMRVISYPVRSYSDQEVKGFFDLDDKESQKVKSFV